MTSDRRTDKTGYPFSQQTMDHSLAGATFDNPASRPNDIPVIRPYHSFIGLSPVMQTLYGEIEHSAQSHAPVFIMGETGTGKEVCAETIHHHSRRAHKPFVAINCAAIPRDLLESELFGHVKGAFTGAIADRDGAARLAEGGTLFLDEVAEMTPDMQTKLLRFLQNFSFRKIGGSQTETADVRIICATNRDPLTEIAAGNLREDLFFRLHVIPLSMPPLRARGDDVIDIAMALLKRYAAEEGKKFTGFSDHVTFTLQQYGWPGNVRQLQNVIRYICVMHDGETVTADMIPRHLLHRKPHAQEHAPATPPRAGTPPSQDEAFENMTLAEIERYAIESAVRRTGGNIPLAAAHLGVAPSTLYRKRLSWNPDQPAPYGFSPVSGQEGGNL